MTTISIQQSNLVLENSNFLNVYDAVEGLLGAVGTTVIWRQNLEDLPTDVQQAYHESLRVNPKDYLNI